MAQVRLGQSIRNVIARAQPEDLARAVYPPVAEPAPGAPTGPSRPRRPAASSPWPWARWRDYMSAGVEHRLRIQAALAEVARSTGSLREDVGVLQDALDLARREVAALSEAARRQSAELEAARASLWRRFDELETKVRPLIAFDEESYAVRLGDGYAMIPRDEPMFMVMVANAGSGGLEPGTRRVLAALIEPGMVVADIGANVGLLTLACARAVGPSGRVHAFEPQSGPRSQLNKTLKLNGLSWVEVHDCAVGARSEEGVFHISPVIGHSSLYALPEGEVATGRDVTVSVKRLDDVLATRLDVVKIDVEGAELDVLEGMTRLLAENRDIALIAEYGPSHLARIGIAPDTWFAAFLAAGFECFAIDEPSGACRPVRPEALTEVVSVNLAFVRPRGQASGRLPLTSAP